MFWLWLRMQEERRRRVWRLYGWFCGLMLFGSCFGIVTWAARMMQLVNLYKNVDAFEEGDDAQGSYMRAQSISFTVVFLVPYAIEFLCLSAAKLMVLDRMSVLAAGHDEGTKKRWAVGGRMVMAVVALGNAVGLAANIAATVHYQKAAEAAWAESAHYASNHSTGNSTLSEELRARVFQEIQFAGSIVSVQSFCEVAVLLIIVVAFVVAGAFCSRVVTSKLLVVHASSASASAVRALKLQVVVTTVFVFAAFLVRSVYSTMRALSAQLRDVGNTCPGVISVCDASCYNVFTHMSVWMNYTPEFHMMVVLVSSPLALLVALWGMTPKQMLQTMVSGQQDTRQVLLRTSTLGPI